MEESTRDSCKSDSSTFDRQNLFNSENISYLCLSHFQSHNNKGNVERVTFWTSCSQHAVCHDENLENLLSWDLALRIEWLLVRVSFQPGIYISSFLASRDSFRSGAAAACCLLAASEISTFRRPWNWSQKEGGEEKIDAHALLAVRPESQKNATLSVSR